MNPQSIVALVLLSIASIPAWAGSPPQLPEPGVLELLAVSAVAGVAIAIRNRRKNDPPRWREAPHAHSIDDQGGPMNPLSVVALVLLSVISIPAAAGPAQLPEPGVLGLIAIGAVAGIAVAIRNRRK